MATIIIDTDTASDDAVAIAMALRSPDVHVAAITTVAGNCNVDQTTANALFTTELCQSAVPVYRGSEAPLRVSAAHATWFHGADCLGDRAYPPPSGTHEALDGVSALVSAIRENPGCVLVTLGPLTNVALALRRAPDIVECVGRCVIMGGTSNTVGNVTPAAEFNLWFDPHAAAEVFASGLPIEMVGWELCRGHTGFDAAEQAHLRAIGTDLANFFLDCNTTAIAAIKKQSGSDRLELPDPVAMAIALDKGRIVKRSSKHHIEIESESLLTRGMSVVDSLDVTNKVPNAEVFWEIEVARFKEMIYQAAQ